MRQQDLRNSIKTSAIEGPQHLRTQDYPAFEEEDAGIAVKGAERFACNQYPENHAGQPYGFIVCSLEIPPGKLTVNGGGQDTAGGANGRGFGSRCYPQKNNP